MEYDLLGDLLTETLKFRDSAFDESLELRDETTISDVLAEEMFNEIDGRWFMRQESIPGDLSIKAIAVDQSGLYIETAPLNEKSAKEVVVEEMLPVSFDTRKRTFLDVHKQQVLISFSETKKVEKDLGARCLWTIPVGEVSGMQLRNAVRVLDLFYSRGCFEVEDDEAVAGPPSQVMVQKLSLGLQQKLSVEQRPILALRTALNVSGQLQLRTELRMMLSLERRIISMGPEQLLDFVVDYVSEHGEERTKNILLFTIAGNIKRAMPKLTWKEARKLARKMVVMQKAS